MFQSYALFEHLSVAENVAFGLKRKRVPKQEIVRRVGEMLELVNLRDRARARPRELSGGQQQRVALARALVNMPALLLLDEPLGALDLKLRRQMQVELKTIQREMGITFVFVTHDQEEALTMSDRIAVMNHGRLEQVAPAAEIYERPATAFAAGFIGASNMLACRAAGDRAEIDGLASVPLPPGPRSWSDGDSLDDGDPARRSSSSPRRQGHDGPVLEAVVADAVFLGATTLLDLARRHATSPFAPSSSTRPGSPPAAISPATGCGSAGTRRTPSSSRRTDLPIRLARACRRRHRARDQSRSWRNDVTRLLSSMSAPGQRHALQAIRGRGTRLTLEDGRTVIDVGSMSANLLGHCHPEVVAAVQAAAESVNVGDMVGYPPREQAAEDCSTSASRARSGWAASRFFVSSSEACRPGAVAGSDAHRPRSAGVPAKQLPRRRRAGPRGQPSPASGTRRWRRSRVVSQPRRAWRDTREIPMPECGRAFQGPDHAVHESCLMGAPEALAGAAAVIMDYSQGGVVPSAQYQDTLAGMAEDAGALWVADETVTALGRMGHGFAFQRGSTRPDMVTMGKGITGGRGARRCADPVEGRR